MISIASNITALRSVNTLNSSTRALYATFEKLATGRRINRASDDPSGLMASDHLRARQAQIEQQIKAMEIESTRLTARDGAYDAVGEMMLDLEGLVVSAASTATMTDGEREAMQIEIDSIVKGVDYAAATTRFGGDLVLEGVSSRTLGEITLLVDDGQGGQVSRSFSLADLATGGELALKSGDMTFAQSVAKAATGEVASMRGAIGNRMKDLDSQARTLTSELEGVVKARSQILDADFAAETANLVRNQVLQQAALYTTQMALTQNAGIAMSLLSGAKNG
ncbi:MAG: hypothetical protein IT436_16660 [Phycisphaerales bacterium]|nr:hypothetical protein [Phycisphaerales bacterium]